MSIEQAGGIWNRV